MKTNKLRKCYDPKENPNTAAPALSDFEEYELFGIKSISNEYRYRATLKSTLPGPFADDEVEVVSTTATPASSYGLQHWVDRDGNALGQITLPLLGWDIIELEAISDEDADAWLNQV